MDLEILREFQDGSGEPCRGPGRVGGPSRRSGTGWETLGEARDGLGDPRKIRMWIGLETLTKIQDGSGGSETSRWSFGEFRDRSGNP